MMRGFTLGTAGHIDHGKTRLVEALTGVDTDRLAEEKRRGITIDLGFASLRIGDREIGVVDVPGHEGFVRNMMAGATGIDLALLVVACDEGVMPQTREHLRIVELLGIPGVLVALSKRDLVDDEWLELVRSEVIDLLAPTPYRDAALVPVSALSGEGIDVLEDAMGAAADALPGRPEEDVFRMPIDRAFTVHGTGTVITGTVWHGRLEEGARIRLLPGGVDARVRGLQVHGSAVGSIAAGQRAAIAVARVDRTEVGRGAVAVAGADWPLSSCLTVRLRVAADASRPVRHRQRVRVHLGTGEVMARAVPLQGQEIEPGDTGWAQLRLERALVARAGDPFVIRSYSPVTTIGGGRVVEPAVAKRRRLANVEAEALEAVLESGWTGAAFALARLSGTDGVAIHELAIRLPGPFERMRAEALGAAGLTEISGRLYDPDLAGRLRRTLVEAVDTWHRDHPLQPGMPREILRRSAPSGSRPSLVNGLLDDALRSGLLDGREEWILLPGFRPTPSRAQRDLGDRILSVLERAGLEPPSFEELSGTVGDPPDFAAVLHLLEMEGAIQRVGSGELVAATSALKGLAARVRADLFGRGGLAPADFREVMPVSRKFLIPLLEYLDGAGITVRSGDGRSVPGHE